MFTQFHLRCIENINGYKRGNENGEFDYTIKDAEDMLKRGKELYAKLYINLYYDISQSIRYG